VTLPLSRPWRTLGLDVVTLRVYAAAIEEKSLAAAAQRENIALSAVSRRISDLESRSGILLLNRHDRGVTPTTAGQALFSRLGDAFAIFEQIASELDAMRCGTMGRVRVQAHMSAASLLLLARLATFQAERPTVEIEIEEVASPEIVQAVQMGRTDVGFVCDTTVPDGLICRPWHKEELVVVLPKNHAHLRDRSIRFDALLDFPFVSMQKSSSLHELFHRAAQKQGRTLNVVAHASSFESARRMVSAGLGISVLPKLEMLNVANDDVEERELNEAWATRSLMIIHRPLDQLAACARQLALFLDMTSVCAGINHTELETEIHERSFAQ
jgi:DNA-binding transcriptional LysR family regulator